MAFEPAYHPIVRLVDIDGTIIKHQGIAKYWVLEPLPGAIKQINEWFQQGDYICLFTGRPSAYRDQTIKQLDDAGFCYHQLIMDKPYSHNMHIYDDNPITVHKIERNKGIGQYQENGGELNEHK